MDRVTRKVLCMKLVRIPNRKTEQDIVYGATRGSSGEIILLVVLGLLILAAIFFHQSDTVSVL